MSLRGSPHAPLFFASFFFISVESLAYDAAMLSRRAVPEIGGSQGGPQVPEMDSPLSDAESYAPMQYEDPYAKGPLHVTSPQRVTFARSQSPLSQSSSPRSPGSHRDASMDDEEVRPPDHRHFSTQSSTSVRTFEGGTKFIESF
ncbi:hypothetical protein BDR03DRAFT_959740 [Suillus americanus]|nr:hypothetical protein BDR03DRAFT_959740 [Suillus americanus]